MTLKGEWSGDVTYSVGDVARYPNGNFYQLVRPCKAGTPCADALFWNYLPSPLQECVKMIMDMVAGIEAKIPTNIDDEAITLKTETGEYVITVDDSGDEPELVVTADETEGT
jgi:hypothetical protein